MDYDIHLLISIYDGSWTEWSAIWSEIIQVILKLDEHAVQVQFEIMSMIPQWAMQSVFLKLIRCIVTYPVNSTIQHLNNLARPMKVITLLREPHGTMYTKFTAKLPQKDNT